MPTDQEKDAIRAELEARYGEVYSTDELRANFDVESFAYCMVIVRRRADGKRGVMDFTHSPRYYFDFTPMSE